METIGKTCFKCGIEKPRTEFYRHSQMGDGLLGKCKDCAKSDARQHRKDPMYRDYVLAYDRARRPAKYGPSNPRSKLESQELAIRRSARVSLGNAVRDGAVLKPLACEFCKSNSRLHGHHHDYSKPLAVVWLCVACHRQHHAIMDLIERALRKYDELSA